MQLVGYWAALPDDFPRAFYCRSWLHNATLLPLHIAQLGQMWKKYTINRLFVVTKNRTHVNVTWEVSMIWKFDKDFDFGLLSYMSLVKASTKESVGLLLYLFPDKA